MRGDVLIGRRGVLADLEAWAHCRTNSRREIFNALCWVVRTGAQRRMLPHDFASWLAVNSQAQRWLGAKLVGSGEGPSRAEQEEAGPVAHPDAWSIWHASCVGQGNAARLCGRRAVPALQDPCSGRRRGGRPPREEEYASQSH
jgi:hypothetical protein